MKKLDILIPQWKEPDEIVKPLLDSIAMQIGVNLKRDVGVIIVNDGTDVYLSDELLNSYNLDIRYIKAEYGGISATRNRALDASEAEYVMFCDDDDMFFSALGIYTIFEYIDKMDSNGKRGFDVLTTVFKEEKENPLGKSIYLNYKKDKTFIHGKVYRRKYLIDNNIRFHSRVPLHEDVYFNGLALMITDDIIEADNCFYVWRNNKKSVTRSTKSFVLDTFETLIICYDEMIKAFMGRGLIDCARVNTANIMYRMYYETQTEIFKSHPDRLEVLRTEMGKFYVKYKYLYDRVKLEEKIELLSKIKLGFLEGGLLFDEMTFEEWLEWITK